MGPEHFAHYYGVEIDGNMFSDLQEKGIGEVPSSFFHTALAEFVLPYPDGVDAILFVQVIHMMELNSTFTQLPSLLAPEGRTYIGMQSYEGVPRLFETVTG